MNTILEVENLHVSFDDGSEVVEALDGVSFSVSRGERVAVIGRSGSGKSTLLRVLSGLVTPDEGYAQVGDQIIGPGRQPDRSLYSQVGLVFQDYGLVPQLTAVQNVMCGSLHASHGLAKLGRFSSPHYVRARRILTQLGLGDRIENRASKLSGGEQQRVAIARLLFQQPELMLLDEPVASLDIHWAKTAIDLMDATNDGNSTLVMVVHDLSMARQFADRVIFIDEGQVIFDGDPDEACCRLEAHDKELPCQQPPLTDGSVDGSDGAIPLPTYAAECPEGHACDTPPVTPPEVDEIDNPPVEPTPDGVGGLWGKTSFYATVFLLAIALYVWAAIDVEFSIFEVFSNTDNAVDFVGRMFPPDFDVAATVTESLVETVQMALIGTTLAAIISLPISVMAARNISAKPIQAGARLVLNGLRTIPSIIWGLFFVAIVGLGPTAGILALTFYAAGYLGKFYYEGIESIDSGPIRSLRTVGASPVQQFRWGVFPQVLPLMLGYTLYMFEYNVRAASILGIVGAGGIGFYLYTYIQNFQYDQAATALLLLLVVVTIIDSASSRLRARLMD